MPADPTEPERYDHEQAAQLNAAYAGVLSANAEHWYERYRQAMELMIAAQRERNEAHAEIRHATFLFGALGHGGEHDDCDPCAFVRRHLEATDA